MATEVPTSSTTAGWWDEHAVDFMRNTIRGFKVKVDYATTVDKQHPATEHSDRDVVTVRCGHSGRIKCQCRGCVNSLVGNDVIQQDISQLIRIFQKRV